MRQFLLPREYAGGTRYSLRETDLRITLLQCLPKGPKMDSIVRLATEEGVARIVPLYSEHCLLGSGDHSGRQRRWERIARESFPQSGNPRLPVLGQPRTLPSPL